MYPADGRDEQRDNLKRGLHLIKFFGLLWSVFPVSGFVFYVKCTCVKCKNAKIEDFVQSTLGHFSIYI